MADIRQLLHASKPPASHTQFSWQRCCASYFTPNEVGDSVGEEGGERAHPQSEAVNASDTTSTSNPGHHFVAVLLEPKNAPILQLVAEFLAPGCLLRLSRVSSGTLIGLERSVWYRLLGERRSRLRELSRQYNRQTQATIGAAAAGSRDSVAAASAVPPPYCWRHLYMRRLCKPWVQQTRKLIEGVSCVRPDGSFRQKYESHLFEVVIVGYNAAALVRAHCERGRPPLPPHGPDDLKHGGGGGSGGVSASSRSTSSGRGLASAPSDTTLVTAQQRSSAYFTEHFYEDARPPYMETHIWYHGLVAQLQISSQSMSTGFSGEYQYADAVVFVFAHSDKDGWRQITSVDIPLVESTVEPGVPRFIVCIVDEASSDLNSSNTAPNGHAPQSVAHDYYKPSGDAGIASSQRSLYGGAAPRSPGLSPSNRGSLKVGDAAAFARQHGFFFIEVPANYKASGGVGVLHKTEAVDSVFFAIGATLLDNAKRELATVHAEIEGTSPLLEGKFMPTDDSFFDEVDDDPDAAFPDPAEGEAVAFDSFREQWFDQSESSNASFNPSPSGASKALNKDTSVRDRDESGWPADDGDRSSGSIGEVPRRKHHKFASGDRPESPTNNERKEVGCDVQCGCLIS